MANDDVEWWCGNKPGYARSNEIGLNHLPAAKHKLGATRKIRQNRYTVDMAVRCAVESQYDQRTDLVLTSSIKQIPPGTGRGRHATGSACHPQLATCITYHRNGSLSHFYRFSLYGVNPSRQIIVSQRIEFGTNATMIIKWMAHQGHCFATFVTEQ